MELSPCCILPLYTILFEISKISAFILYYLVKNVILDGNFLQSFSNKDISNSFFFASFDLIKGLNWK